MKHPDILKNKRYVEIFKKLVNMYIETGEPVGSRCLSKTLDTPLSPATIRNVMSDLESIGILYAEHSSSGRKPTEKGWRFFVNSLVETANISEIEKAALSEIQKNATEKSLETILETATDVLSNLSNCVSLVLTPKLNSEIKHVDFMLLNPGTAVLIAVDENGTVENRLIKIPTNVTPAILEQARNYINAKLNFMGFQEIRKLLHSEISAQKDDINLLVRDILSKGIDLIEKEKENEKIIIKGRSNLVPKANEIKQLEYLLRQLDETKTLKNILDESINGQGIQIFIGSETKMFEIVNCSLVIAPYFNSEKKLIGSIGIIGPTRMEYGKAITLVDYTAKLLGSLL